MKLISFVAVLPFVDCIAVVVAVVVDHPFDYSCSSGSCSLQGFVTAMVGEVFVFNSVRLSSGMVVNIQRERYIGIRIGALILQYMDKLSEGSVVSASGVLVSMYLSL